MRSLQAKLLAGTLTATIVVLFAAGLALFALTRSVLLDDFDASLASMARALTALVEEEDGRIEMELRDSDMPEFSRKTNPEYYELRRASGTIVARSVSLRDKELDVVAPQANEAVFRSVTLPDGRPGRIAVIRFSPRSENEDKRASRHSTNTKPEEFFLAVARDTLDLDNTLRHLRVLMTGIGATAVLSIAVLLVAAVRGGLRPVRELAAQIADLNETVLSARVTARHVPTELSGVVDQLNNLLSRLERAFLRERTFTADVAHELRTPLAGLRATLEVALSKERESRAYKETLDGSLLIARQMQVMVDNLLTLTRAESGQLPLDMQSVELTALAREAWDAFASRAAERGISVHWSRMSSCIIQTDRERLGHILRNLFDNAMSYVNEGGEILIEIAEADGEGAVTISNTGSTLSAEDCAHVFDRFWRKDESRGGTGVHCGLGLSLAKRIAELLGGSMEAESDGGLFRIRLILPLTK